MSYYCTPLWVTFLSLKICLINTFDLTRSTVLTCLKFHIEAENTPGFCSHGLNELVDMRRDGGTGAACQVDSLGVEQKHHKRTVTEIRSHQHSSVQLDNLRAPQQQHLLSVSAVLPTAACLNQTHSRKTLISYLYSGRSQMT